MVPCQDANDCDFEQDTFCGWDNDKKTDQFDWEITQGPSSETVATGTNPIKIHFQILFLLFQVQFSTIHSTMLMVRMHLLIRIEIDKSMILQS